MPNSSKGKDKKPQVHKELDGLDLKINAFGEIIGNKSIEEINQFLNKHVTDRKLEDREGSFSTDDKE